MRDVVRKIGIPWGQARRGILWALLLWTIPSLALGASVDDLRRAKDHFEYGEYEEARKIAEALLRQNVLATDEHLIDANRVVALSYLYGDAPDKREKAQQYFLQLLSIEPDYRLDPFFTPPAAVEFFNEVRRQNEERLAPIREQRRLAKQARAAEESARRRFLEEQAKEREVEQSQEPLLVERRHFALVFLPLGAGQFQNGQKGAGIAIASVQVAAGLTSLASYLVVENLKGRDGRYPSGNIRAATDFNTIKWVSGAIFYGAWLYGVLDAWRGFEPETVTELHPATAAVDLEPRFEVSSDGATVGLSFRF